MPGRFHGFESEISLQKFAMEQNYSSTIWAEDVKSGSPLTRTNPPLLDVDVNPNPSISDFSEVARLLFFGFTVQTAHYKKIRFAGIGASPPDRPGRSGGDAPRTKFFSTESFNTQSDKEHSKTIYSFNSSSLHSDNDHHV